jgi:UDP-N-acetylglucosamine 4,6-dehydratase
MRIGDLADAIAPGVPRRIIGIRPGEKIHEVLVTEDESRHAVEFDDHYVIRPSFPFWREEAYPEGQELPPNFRYSSELNGVWLEPADLLRLVDVAVVD